MGRNSSKALASPKVSKTQKKVPEDVNNQENRASQMITSSARKKTRGICLDNDSYIAINNMSVDSEGCETIESFSNGTIFSLAFHISRNTEGEIVDGVRKQPHQKMYKLRTSCVNVSHSHNPGNREHTKATTQETCDREMWLIRVEIYQKLKYVIQSLVQYNI
ncbi:unnamed protein product [Lactuca saligna]|uniref:Uncharacterized protein n=1 Tax=Lactuca saligna TaxID=75948 RepID=A0AA35YP61_LACSI|nr:unnamed protein product [Lactuca saligna]